MKEKPVSTYYVARKNLYKKPFRTMALAVIIMIFSAILFGGSIFTHNLSLGTQGMANRLGADILIVPYGYEKDLEVALLRGEPSTFYLKADLQDKIKNIEGIEAISSQLFLASLSAGCCTSKVQLIGYDPDTDFVITPWMNNKLTRPLALNEVVVGSKITAEVGEEIHFFNHPFIIAAKMDSTGMGFDTSVFMTLETAHGLTKKAQLVTGDTENLQDYISSLFIRVSPDVEPKQVVNRIMQQYAVDYNLDVVMTKGMITNIHQWLNNFSYVVYGLSGLFGLLATVVIMVVFSSSLNERKREISLLRILGASRAMLVRLILSESIIICALGGLSGIILSGIILLSFNTLLCQTLGLPCENISTLSIICYAILTFILLLIMGPLASIYSTLSLTRFDTYSTLRAGE